MTPIELSREALNALLTPGKLGVVLVFSRGARPPGFPRGEFLNEMVRGGVLEKTYSFKPQKVLDWLLKNQLVSMSQLHELRASMAGAAQPEQATQPLSESAAPETGKPAPHHF